MSTISTTPRRPSTAQPSLNPRMPYEAAEALLWERQNHRVHAHLSAQMKELQAQHDAYESRIAATEAVAEAAEAAVLQVKHLEAKVRAIEEEEQDRPFDRWAKEAVGQLQVAVDGLKGIRGKISGLELKVDRLGEDVESVRDEGALLRGVVRRLEALEGTRRGDSCRQPEAVGDDVIEETYDEVPADDNPLAVFYGIDTQSPTRRQSSPMRRQEATSIRQPSPSSHHETAAQQSDAVGRNVAIRQHDHPGRKPTKSPQRRSDLTGDLQPPDKQSVMPEEDTLDLREAAPAVEYSWENTQQFKAMQKELEELRAMCRSQDTKGSNNTADATQRPQETLIVPKENNPGFSDATTETEADFNDTRLESSRPKASQGQWDVPSSDFHLPSSPPKRSETQSARARLMKRPSIHDPRILSMNEHGQIGNREPAQVPTSLLVKLPVDTRAGTAKRKRIDEAPTQRVVRPRLGEDTVVARQPAASKARKVKANADRSMVDTVLPMFPDDSPAHPSPTRKIYGKQKPTAKRPVLETAPQASSSGVVQEALTAAEPAISAAEPVKTRKVVSKSKPTTKKSTKQPAQASASTAKAHAVVKQEAKATRQPNGACKSCRARHQKCDRNHPTCGRCAKGGLSCEYPIASVPSGIVSAASPKKKHALSPTKKAANEADCERVLRGRSVTVSPEAPLPAKRPTPASLSKKPTVAAAPTAASSRAPRAKNTQKTKASPQRKQK